MKQAFNTLFLNRRNATILGTIGLLTIAFLKHADIIFII